MKGLVPFKRHPRPASVRLFGAPPKVGTLLQHDGPISRCLAFSDALVSLPVALHHACSPLFVSTFAWCEPSASSGAALAPDALRSLLSPLFLVFRLLFLYTGRPQCRIRCYCGPEMVGSRFC